MNDKQGNTPVRRPTYMADPETPATKVAPRDAVREHFARKLQELMAERGWNQSDLARAATLHLPEGQEMQRDAISKYVNMKAMPSPVNLKAIASALNVSRADLVPVTSVLQPQAVPAAVGVHDVGDGMAWLRINQAVSWEIALKVMELVKGDTKA